MGKDMTVPCDNGFINIRVGAIIMKDGKFLMAGNKRQDYLYSVGGRVQFGETAEQAVVREVMEETGVRMEVDRLGFVCENYFIGDSGYNKDKPVYELAFYYYMKTPEGFEPTSDIFMEGDDEEFLAWITPDEPRKYYPEFFREELKHPMQELKYFSVDDR